MSEAVTSLVASVRPDFVFRATGVAIGHHGTRGLEATLRNCSTLCVRTPWLYAL
jgi:hypothetical protein